VTLIGRWKKVPGDPCDRRYPEELQFFEATYLGRKGPGQGFILWDAGGYELLGPNQVKFDIVTDQQVVYRLSVSDSEFTAVDPQGCTLRYRRAD
jgi:hypothetical protein